ncbi:MAG: hypothetical protein AMJ53_18435 [Gammaproteobacteria bacterium SG8_11]|nr:MAG: hypothetical protein AMJ53_18435 [Gammaproteobacteria bacterium SG8_11]
MNTNLLVLVTSWSAYLSAAATILTFVTGILFFTVGGAFGKINDISSVFQVLFMIPLALVLYRLLPDNTRMWGLIAALIGIAGMLVAAYGQSLLVFGKIDFEGSMRYFPAGAAIGIWLIVTGAFTLSHNLFPNGLAWTGILAGVSYIVIVLAFLIKGQQNMVFYIGGLVLGISYPVWAIWLGRLIGTGTLIVKLS